MNPTKEEQHGDLKAQEVPDGIIDNMMREELSLDLLEMYAHQLDTDIENDLTFPTSATTVEESVDLESKKGRFGWATLGDVHITHIFRLEEKCCSAYGYIRIRLYH